MAASTGRILLISKGDYNPSTEYYILDIVRDGGKTWVCKQTCTGQVPAENTYWFLLCQDGASGTVGSIWYTGTGITGTSETPTIFSGSGITSANATDMYLNSSTGNVYQCTTGGNAATAEWVFVISLYNNYNLPTASDSVKGGIKIGANLTMDGDTLNAAVKGLITSENDFNAQTESTSQAVDSYLAKKIITDIAGSGIAHNSIYRGNYLGTSVTIDQYAAISAGTFEDLYIGDYWTIGGVNYRIAAFDYYINCGNTPLTAHHAVIVPEKNLYNAAMNTANTTTGGYVGSQMYTTNLEQAKTTIKAAFSGHVVNHRIYLVNAVANGYSSGGAWVDSEVDIMNEQMVYGGVIFSPVSTGSAVPANYRVEKNQLPLFAMNPAMLNTGENYWLRDVITASNFALAGDAGNAYSTGASYSLGVRPAFCIS